MATAAPVADRPQTDDAFREEVRAFIAEYFPAEYKGRKCGVLGDLGCPDSEWPRTSRCLFSSVPAAGPSSG